MGSPGWREGRGAAGLGWRGGEEQEEMQRAGATQQPHGHSNQSSVPGNVQESLSSAGGHQRDWASSSLGPRAGLHMSRPGNSRNFQGTRGTWGCAAETCLSGGSVGVALAAHVWEK